MSTPPPPRTLPLGQALERSEPLSRLLQRVQASRDALEAVLPALPAELHASVRPGPWDEGQWTLLLASSSAAAKIRHCLPSLQERLRQAGHPTVTIRIKVMPTA